MKTFWGKERLGLLYWTLKWTMQNKIKINDTNTNGRAKNFSIYNEVRHLGIQIFKMFCITWILEIKHKKKDFSMATNWPF